VIPKEIKAKDIAITATFGRTQKKTDRGRKLHRGYCVVCKGEDRPLASVKGKYCIRCWGYIKEYLNAKYGAINTNKTFEAIEFLQKPIPCRFHSICGNYVPLFKGGKRNSKRICPTCFKIWYRGFLAGRTVKTKSQGDSNLEEFYGDLLNG